LLEGQRLGESQAASGARLRDRLTLGPPLLLDAAMGTELEKRGVASGLPLWSARALLSAPSEVLAIHRENVEAGADVLTANTFRTNRRTLEKESLGERAVELTRRAVDLAREAAGRARRPVFALGCLSPVEDCYRPDLAPAPGALDSEHREQAHTLAAAGVDGILVETQNSVVELAAAVRAARDTGLPVIASVVTDGAGLLLSGEPLQAAAKALRELGADVIGVNCVPARRVSQELRRFADAAPDTPLVAYGNLGPPSDPDGLHFTDEVAPADYAALAKDWLALGARLIGGCCGTTAAHTAALRHLIDTMSE
jgi:S-methylmethionine-dependent homocysteine/selenocysteine methylase